MNYPRENMLAAVWACIQIEMERCKREKMNPSAFLLGLGDLKKAINDGEQIHLTD